MTKSQQSERFNRVERAGEKFILRELGIWTREVVTDWTPGMNSAPAGAQTELEIILRRAYDKISREMLGVEWQLYKQQDEEEQVFDLVMTGIAVSLSGFIAERQKQAAGAIITTLEKFAVRSTQAAAEIATSGMEYTRAARTDLARRLQRHRLIIAMTEAGTMAGEAHRTAVLAVQDPLKNTVERVLAFIEAGDYNSARILSRRVMELARLPVSVSQGQLISTISDIRDRLVTPVSQARILSTLRNRAAELDVLTKTWNTIGDERVRPSHAAKDGETIPLHQLFTLDGGMMLQPRDGSLGASLSEIVNCRCFLTYD